MTPKEKADELVRAMYKVRSNSASLITLYFAKQYALIAVDEIINANPYKWVPFMDHYTEKVLTSDKGYWLEVKKEIEQWEVNNE